MDTRERTRTRRAHLGVLVCLCFALQQFCGPLHLLWHEHVLAAHTAHGPGDVATVEDCQDEGHQPLPAIEHVEVSTELAVSPLRVDSSVHVFAPAEELIARALAQTGATFSSTPALRAPPLRARCGPRAPPVAL